MKSQNTIIYPGSVIELRFILNRLKRKKILFVRGRNSHELSGAKEKLEWLSSRYNITYFDDFKNNPDSIDVMKGVGLFNQHKCELILSVGGGSTLDMAKLINYYNTHDVDTIHENNISNDNFSPVQHICIPTTAGSGSEATHFAVMYIGDKKTSIANEKLIPDYVIIDPELHYSQSTYQKAVSGADAFAQAIESLWSIQSTEESRTYSETALKLIWQNLPNTVQNGDEIAHLKVSIGAHLAGKAINIAKTTAAHALSYGFTYYSKLPHGHAVALFLPYFCEFNDSIDSEKCNDPRGLSFVKNQIVNINRNLDPEIPLKDNVVSFFKRIGLEANFKNLKISYTDYIRAIERVNTERLSNNPISISNGEINDIYHKQQ